MANHKSAIKRHKQSLNRAARNRAARDFYARCGFTEKSINLELL